MTSFIFTFIACSKNYHSAKTPNILSKVDNKHDKDELITKTISKNEILSNKNKIQGMSIDDIDKKFGIECLRKSGEWYYSVHKASEGGYIYILYEVDKDFIYACGRIYVSNSIKKEDFKTVEKNKATLDDIMKIDSAMQLNQNEKGETFSVHLLAEGDVICLYYKDLNGIKIVSDIIYTPPDDKSIFKIIQPKDLPVKNINDK